MRAHRVFCNSIRTFSLSLILFGVLTGCDDAPASEKFYLDQANQAYEKGEMNSGVIHLKNSIKHYPKSWRARLMLGRIYVELGDPKPAEKELLVARDLGATNTDIAVLLGKAWLQLGKYNDILEEFKVDGDNASLDVANILAIRGYAYFGKQEIKLAENSFETALEHDQNNIESLFGLCRINLSKKDLAAAQFYLDRANAAKAKPFQVALLQGDIDYFAKDYSKSAASFKVAAIENKENLLPLLGLSRAQFAQADYTGAAATLDRFLEYFGNHADALYLRALTAYRQKDFAKSKEVTERMLLADEYDMRSLLLAGYSNYAVNELETARRRLTRYLANDPKNDNAKRMLATTLIRLNEHVAAVEQLQSLAAKYPEDTGLIVGLAVASARQGKFLDAEKYYRDAIAVKPKDPALKAQLKALMQVKSQHEYQGTTERKFVTGDVVSDKRRAIEFSQALSAKEYEKARAIARDVQKEKPKRAIGFQFEAMVELALRNIDESRSLLQKALVVEPGAEDAALNLAKLEMALKRNETAHSVLAGTWAVNPKAYRVLTQLVALDIAFGDAKSARKRLTKAIEQDPESTVPVLLLAKEHLRGSEQAAAIELLELYVSKQGENSDVLDLLATIYYQMGKHKETIPLLQKLVASMPDNIPIKFRLAYAYRRTGDTAAYLNELEVIIAQKNDFIPAKVARIQYYLDHKEFDAAQKHLLDFQLAHPTNPNSGVFAVRLALAENKNDRAVQLAIEYLAAKNPPIRTLNLLKAEAQWRMDNKVEAVNTLENFLKEKSKDHQTWTVLAGYYKKLNNLNAAEKAYRKVAELVPKSWIANNNLAFILLETGERQEAQIFADIALKLAANQPMVLHTAGLVNMANGKIDIAEQQLAKVVQMRPKRLDYLYDYAKILLEAGKKGEAKKILNKILAADAPDAMIEKVKELKANL